MATISSFWAGVILYLRVSFQFVVVEFIHRRRITLLKTNIPMLCIFHFKFFLLSIFLSFEFLFFLGVVDRLRRLVHVLSMRALPFDQTTCRRVEGECLLCALMMTMTELATYPTNTCLPLFLIFLAYM